MGFFGFGKKNKEKEQEKMKTGLEKTRTGFWGNILNTLTGSVIDDDMYDDLEEQLILADVGGEVAVRLEDKLRDRRRRDLPCRSQLTAGELGRPRRCAHCERRRGRRPGGCHFRHRKVCHRTRL